MVPLLQPSGRALHVGSARLGWITAPLPALDASTELMNIDGPTYGA